MSSRGRLAIVFGLPLLAACSSGAPHEAATDAAVTDDASDATASDAASGEAASDGAAYPDAGAGSDSDAPSLQADATDDAGDGCFISAVGVPGACLSTAACAALGAYTSTPGYCPGPADIQCCAPTPSVADDPPVPAGWVLMQQSAVTADMTAWAVQILDDPTGYPMFSTTMMTFGTQLVMARVEWHPPDFQNGAIHRGVTLYVPA